MSLTIQLPVTTEDYLRANANREGMPVESYISQLLTATSIPALSKRKKKPWSEEELIKYIQLDVQSEDLLEYYRLKLLFQSGKINEQERETLIQLNNLIEIAHAKRMAYVVQLAELRKVSLEKLMADLGIKQKTA